MNSPANVPIVDITVFGDSSNIDSYAKTAYEWAKRELIPNSPIHCPCLNKYVYFSNKKVRHTIMHKKFDQKANFDEETIAAISEFEGILQNASHRYTTDDRKGREEHVAIHMVIGKVNINDEIRNVEILIQEIYHAEHQETRLHFYNHILK